MRILAPIVCSIIGYSPEGQPVFLHCAVLSSSNSLVTRSDIRLALSGMGHFSLYIESDRRRLRRALNDTIVVFNQVAVNRPSSHLTIPYPSVELAPPPLNDIQTQSESSGFKST